MSFNKKDFKNNINLSGIVYDYLIKKDTDAKRMFDSEGRFKRGDKYTSYNGYISVLTSVEPMNYVRVNVQTEYKTYKSGNNVGKPTSATLALEEMANKTLPTYRKTGKVNETPTVSVFGNEPYNFKFTDNFYFKKDTMELVETINTDLGFANLVIGDPVDEPRFSNEFTIHAYASKLDEELDKDGLPTGRMVVTASVPYTYGRDENEKVLAFDIPLIGGLCEDEEGEYDMAEYLVAEEEDQGFTEFSWELVGSIHSWTDAPVQQVEEGTSRRGRGRKAKEVVNGKHMVEFLLEGFYILGEDGDVFSQDDMLEASKARQVLVETKRKKAEESSNEPQASTQRSMSGRASGRGGASASTSGTTRSSRRGW